MSWMADRLNAGMRRIAGVLGGVVVTGIVLVLLAIASVNMVDTMVIERAAEEDRLDAFLRAATATSRIIGNVGNDIRDVKALDKAFVDIMELRPGLRRLSVYDVSGGTGVLITTTDQGQAPTTLTEQERISVRAGRAVSWFDDAQEDRGWVITAPVIVKGHVMGALRGKFSIAKYDRLIEQERAFGKVLAVAMVALTSLVFLLLLRAQVHRPVALLLQAMRRTEGGDLASQAPLGGSSDIREVVSQYNRMVDRIREAAAVKEQLLQEIHRFNDTLQRKVSETTEELRRTHAMLGEARAQAERAEKLAALGELSAVVAHELGNPLNAIFGNLQMLEHDATIEDRDRHLSVVRAEVKRMIEILHHILESTRVRTERSPVDLNAVIQDVLAVNAPGLPHRSIELVTDLPQGLAPVAADTQTLHGLIFNLVTNAIQAMPQGGELAICTRYIRNEETDGTLVVAGTPELEDGAIRLIVRDSGHGIPSEYVHRIFEPFFTTRQAQRGTGLGLAICHRAVSAAGGRLAVQSAVGQGTTFIIDLPLWRGRRLGEASDGE
ncbi:MAG: HAMP domain-containing protein [Nitrospirota bacterium]|nr:HAMP domain-containing protein [Nitrospirota bacterium]MDE3221308.1 HAMP domain-containing protein [Nitrospirota bacterium]